MKQSESLMTVLIQPDTFELPNQQSEWKTSWYHCDTESCILSSYLPCHIYSKVISTHRSHYKWYFLVFLVLYGFYYTTIVGWIYLPTLTCKGAQVVSCVMYDKDTCNDGFVIVNDIHSYQCFWSESIQLCIPTTNQECIQEAITKGNLDVIYVCFSILSFVVFFVNYQFRSSYQGNNRMTPKPLRDCLITFFLPICSNAQIYRDNDIKNNDFITV
jgi:hypothetical protein